MKNRLNDFKNYLLNNPFVILICITTGLLVYGAKIFNYSIGVDSDVFLQNPNDFMFNWNIEEGRFGLTIIQMLFFGDISINYVFSNLLSVFFLLISCLVWLFLFSMVYEKRNTWADLLFSVFYISSIVWLEVIYFNYMAFQCMLGVLLVSISVLMTYELVTSRRYIIIIPIVLLLTISISIYQILIIMYISGMIIVAFLEIQKKDYTLKEIKSVSIMISSVVVGSLVLYSLLNYLICNLYFKLNISNYVTDRIGANGEISLKIIRVCKLIYTIIIGNMNCLDSIMLKFMDDQKLLDIHILGTRGSIVFGISIVICLVLVILSKKKRIQQSVLLVSMLFSTVAVAIIGDGTAATRYLHTVPLVFGFLIYYSILNLNLKCLFYIWVSICLLFGGRQCWNTSLISEEAIRQYQDDVYFCHKLDEEIHRYLGEKYGKEITLLVIGDNSDTEKELRGELVGVSAVSFGAKLTKNESSLRTVPFMNAIGYKNYKALDLSDDRIDDLRMKAKTMKCFPNSGSICEEKGVVIVKISDFAYDE